jgi:aspartate-semialdehyde dehydrogenase
MESRLRLVIVGAEGLIGETLLQSLADHPWLTGQVELLGSGSSAGAWVEFGRQELQVGDAALYEFDRRQIVISTGEEEIDSGWLEAARQAGAIVLDTGANLLSAYDLPPVVAAVNPTVIEAVADGGIIALPDAATTQLATLLYAIADGGRIQRVSVVSCHAVSELGRSGVEEMARQTAQLLNGKPAANILFSRQIAFNLIPQVGQPLDDGLSATEQRMTEQTLRLLGQPDMELSVSCCWVPVFFGHSQAVDLSLGEPMSVDDLRTKLSATPEIHLSEATDYFPTAVTDASGNDGLAVGRIRTYPKRPANFSLWTIADNLRFGVVGNAVKILEILVKNYL